MVENMKKQKVSDYFLKNGLAVIGKDSRLIKNQKRKFAMTKLIYKAQTRKKGLWKKDFIFMTCLKKGKK